MQAHVEVQSYFLTDHVSSGEGEELDDDDDDDDDDDILLTLIFSKGTRGVTRASESTEIILSLRLNEVGPGVPRAHAMLAGLWGISFSKNLERNTNVSCNCSCKIRIGKWEHKEAP